MKRSKKAQFIPLVIAAAVGVNLICLGGIVFISLENKGRDGFSFIKGTFNVAMGSVALASFNSRFFRNRRYRKKHEIVALYNQVADQLNTQSSF